MTTFVEFKLDAGGTIWIDSEQVKAVTTAIDGGARLWVGGGDFFEVSATATEVIATIRGGRGSPVSSVRHLHTVAVD